MPISIFISKQCGASNLIFFQNLSYNMYTCTSKTEQDKQMPKLQLFPCYAFYGSTICIKLLSAKINQ